MGPSENKGLLSQRLEKDREEMAVQVDELKEHYNLVRTVTASIRKDPLSWIIATALVGVLLSRLLGRPKEIFLSTESVDRTRGQEQPRFPWDDDKSTEAKKLLSVAKWALGAYLIQEFDRCLVQPFRYLAERIRKADLASDQTRRYLRDLEDWIDRQSQSLSSSLRGGINKGSPLADLLRKQLKKLKR
ncbi:MAG: hypothetical protein JO025_03570 [Verrucomicrobia bacterium]|nr:hypothetical protein [Verrucomicrobiota bacterium]